MTTNKEIGDQYEKYVLEHIRNTTGNECWLWRDIPHKKLIKYGFITDLNKHRLARKIETDENFTDNPLMDTGIDIVQITDDNKIIGVQCKYGYKTLCANNLNGFYCMLFNYNLSGALYYTQDKHNKSKIHFTLKEVSCNKNLSFIKLNMEKQPEKMELIGPITYKLYDYQQIAVDKSIEYFKENNRG